MTAGHRSPTKSGPKKSADRATRFSAELFEAAQTVGEKQNRSARQQLEYWAAVGRSVTTQTSSSQSRVEAALAGTLPVESLSHDEDIVFDAVIDADVESAMQETNLAQRHAARGTRAVYMDEDGQIVELSPDGTITPLAP